MNARDIVIGSLRDINGIDPEYDDGIDADTILATLAAAGLSVVPTAEVERLTLHAASQQAKAHQTTTAVKMMADVVRSWGFDNKPQESNGLLVRRALDELHAENARLRDVLVDARLQLEYLDSRWPTGTTPAILARINAALAKEAGV